MKKILILSLFVCFAFSVSAQSKSAIKQSHRTIAKEYVQQNPTDAKAATLVNSNKITPEYIAYFKKVSPKYNAFVAKRKVRANRN